MMTEFEHDATPTWSGFIYQGHVAMYLAVRKICELLESPHPMEVQKIAISFNLEVENWEDVAIFSEDEQGKTLYFNTSGQKQAGTKDWGLQGAACAIAVGKEQAGGIGAGDAGSIFAYKPQNQ